MRSANPAAAFCTSASPGADISGRDIGDRARSAGAAPGPCAGDAHSICIVLHDFALGGTERIALRLAEAWSGAGRAVTIVCGTARGPLAPLIAGSAARVVEVPGGIARQPGSVARLGRAAARFLRDDPHDLCFIPGNYHWRAIPPIAALPPSLRPAIVAQLSSPISKPQRRGLRRVGFRWTMRRLLRDVDALVTLAAPQEWETRRLLGGTPVCTIPLPALADVAPPPRAAEGHVVMAAGRLVPQKGFDDLIAAFALLDDATATLLIVGEGPERSRLEALAARLGVADRVALPGFAEDIRPALDRARIFVLSSRFEGYGAVLIEALAAGRPVLATNCTPATVELLHDARCGEIVRVGDPVAMAAAMARMLARPAPDPMPLARSVERFRIGAVARSYLAIFDRAVGPASAAAMDSAKPTIAPLPLIR